MTRIECDASVCRLPVSATSEMAAGGAAARALVTGIPLSWKRAGRGSESVSPVGGWGSRLQPGIVVFRVGRGGETRRREAPISTPPTEARSAVLK
jgi:hypothetical protein